MEMFDEQPSADLTEFAVAVMHPVQQLDAGQPAFETVEQCFDLIAMREQIAAKVIRLFDVSHGFEVSSVKPPGGKMRDVVTTVRAATDEGVPESPRDCAVPLRTPCRHRRRLALRGALFRAPRRVSVSRSTSTSLRPPRSRIGWVVRTAGNGKARCPFASLCHRWGQACFHAAHRLG